jgi:hypothetical protein
MPASRPAKLRRRVSNQLPADKLFFPFFPKDIGIAVLGIGHTHFDAARPPQGGLRDAEASSISKTAVSILLRSFRSFQEELPSRVCSYYSMSCHVPSTPIPAI